MTKLRVELPEALAEISAKAFLAQQGISHTQWKRIKQHGNFCVNGEPAIATRVTLKNGDIISYDIEKTSDIIPEELPLDIRYEDKYLLIINKPAGQLVHPTTAEAHGTLGNAVLAHFQALGLPLSYHPVHRLDRFTSGLVLIAKQPQVQYLLTTRDGNKKFHRSYLAICTGKPEPPNGLIDAPIARALPSIIERKVSAEGQPARTHYETLASNGNLSLLRLWLETGRTHQIRVHLAHLGHPLIGDDLYGGSLKLIKRQALHAYRLHFVHPLTNKEIDIHAPLPADMEKICKENNFQNF